MRQLIFFIPIIMISCTPENDQEVINRAINDEAMQLINQHFENGNKDLYGEVEKQRAVLQATKGDMPDYTNFNLMDSLFHDCKNFIDEQQDDFTAAYCWPPFDEDEIYPTSCVKKLRLRVDYDLGIMTNKIIETISLTKKINSTDTIYRAFVGLNQSEFEQIRTYSYAQFSSEIDSLISEFENAYALTKNEFEVIDVLEFFTLCRSTLFIAERKVMRFHNETIIPHSQVEIGNNLNAFSLNKSTYSPGEKFEFDVYPVIMCNESFSSITWRIDSGVIHHTPYRQHYCMDTIPLPTNVPGRHRLDVTYTSLSRRFGAFQETFFYTVVEP